MCLKYGEGTNVTNMCLKYGLAKSTIHGIKTKPILKAVLFSGQANKRLSNV